MPSQSLWSRVREARIVRLLAEFFLDAWRDADPDPAVQKLVADARAGLGRLGFRPQG